MDTQNSQRGDRRRPRINSGAVIAIVGVLLLLLPFFLVLLAFGGKLAEWFELPTSNGSSLADVFVQKFNVVFGLPAAAIFSLLLVTILRQTSGPIEFKALGVEFKGASGQVVLWVVCFLAIVAAVKVLW